MQARFTRGIAAALLAARPRGNARQGVCHAVFLTCFLTCFLTLGIGLLCMAGGKVARAQEKPGLLRDDPRLDVSIMVQAEGIPLSDLLSQIASRVGVKVGADEEAGDDKIIVFGPTRPLYAVLNDMAALFGDVWTTFRTPDGAVGYRLTRSARTRRQEAALLNQSKTRMMDALGRQATALAETPEQLRRRAPDDPIRTSLSGGDGRTATSFYALLTGTQQQQLFDTGSTDSFPFAALTPAQQQPLREWFARYVAPQQEYAAKFNDSHSVVMVPTLDDLMRGTVRFLIAREGGQDTEISLQIGKASLPLRRFPPAWRALLPVRGNPYTARPLPALLTLPAAEQTNAAAGAGEWRDQLHQLADKVQLPMMADYYRADAPVAPPDLPASPSVNPDADALDALCRPQSCLWWVQDRTLLMRKREWYFVRQYETPDRWVREMADSLKAHDGKPTYEDVLRLDRLTPLQIAGLGLARGVTAAHLDSLLGLLALLRACALNLHNTLPGQPYMLPDTRRDAAPNTYQTVDPSDKEPLVCNSPVVADLIRRYIAHLPTSPADLSGVKIKLFYSYPYLPDPHSTTSHAYEEAQKHLAELAAGDALDTEEYKRRIQEVTRLQTQEESELLTTNKADGRFAYVNITSILLHKQDDPASPQANSHYELPVGHTFMSGSSVYKADYTAFPISFHYHVVLPRTLTGDRSNRTLVKIMP